MELVKRRPVAGACHYPGEAWQGLSGSDLKAERHATELARLRRETEQQARRQQAGAIIDVQKLCGLFGLSAEPGSEPR